MLPFSFNYFLYQTLWDSLLMAEMLVKHFYRYSAPKKKKMSYFRNQSLIMSLMHKKRAFSITTESPCFKRVMGRCVPVARVKR